MKLKVAPLTEERWPAMEDLFGKTGACSRCWCMYWRMGSGYRKQPAARNKAEFHKLVENGPPPGLLALDGDLAVGWCQLTPRESLPWLEKSWKLQNTDESPVWAISCFYIRKGYRKRGVTAALVAAALKAAKRAGASAVEAYPVDGALSPSTSFTGYASTFVRADFKTVAHHSPPRPIMRYDLRS